MGETWRKSVPRIELILTSTKKSSCKNKYRTSCKFYESFICVWYMFRNVKTKFYSALIRTQSSRISSDWVLSKTTNSDELKFCLRLFSDTFELISNTTHGLRRIQKVSPDSKRLKCPLRVVLKCLALVKNEIRSMH